jgi:hypothetical protein
MSRATLQSRDARRDVSGFEFKVANTPAERRDAFRLVYDAYLRAGLARPNPHRVRVTPYHLLPTTHVFIARYQGEVISTLSLVGDNELGLPMESVYGAEIDRRRTLGLSISEVSCLADRRSSRREFLTVFCGLSRVMAQFARRQGYDQLLVVCHPKHSAFYIRYLGFEVIGGLTECPHVLNKPAVALCLDFDRVDREPPACYERFFGEWLSEEQLRSSGMSPMERRVLATMVDRTFEPGRATAPAFAVAVDACQEVVSPVLVSA